MEQVKGSLGFYLTIEKGRIIVDVGYLDGERADAL